MQQTKAFDFGKDAAKSIRARATFNQVVWSWLIHRKLIIVLSVQDAVEKIHLKLWFGETVLAAMLVTIGRDEVKTKNMFDCVISGLVQHA